VSIRTRPARKKVVASPEQETPTWDGGDGPPADVPPLEEIRVEKEAATAYTSPLLARVQGTRLTVELLQAEVPKVKAGAEAQARLDKSANRMGDELKRKLGIQVQEGERAKEVLFVAALPLIRTIAAREWRRRQQWGSQVSLEDLTQEAIIGFLKGIAGFKTEAIGKSATNYLGQWMLVETRRAAEVLDHDLQVGHDAGERFRKIRALRNRLATELGREPTDEEIAAASRDPNYVTRPGMVGRAPKEGEERVTGKGLTAQQVMEEKQLRVRVGHAARFGTEADSDDDSGGAGIVDPSREAIRGISPEQEEWGSPDRSILDSESARVVADILTAAMDGLGMPAMQRDIIARRFGLPPHQESSAREIARALNLQRDKVSRVIAAFQREMTRKGGAFHAIIVKLDPADVYDVGLGWTLAALGDWPKRPSRRPASSILTDNLGDQMAARPQPKGETRASGYLAWFVCDYHDRTFSGLYQSAQSIPKSRACPSCGKVSLRIKTAPQNAGA
jgi:RNA polymerase sigma factor (sigma-70 family)